MALLLSLASSDNIQHGSDASIDDLPAGANGFSVLMWIYRTSNGNNQCLWSHRGGTGTRLNIRNSGGEGELEFRINRDAPTPTSYQGTAGTIPLNTWTFVAATYQDSLGTEMDLYTGTLTTDATEVTYDTTNNGAGAYITDASVNKQFGNLGTSSLAFGGRIAVVQLFDERLTLTQILEQQYRPHNVSSLVLFSHYGCNGIGPQSDMSGNGNTGTITGATHVRHPDGITHPCGGLNPRDIKHSHVQAINRAATF